VSSGLDCQPLQGSLLHRNRQADVQRQHEILNALAELIDAGQLRATAATSYGRINAENLRRAHAALEGGQVIGKITLAGF
jgi:NADPH:quinone reductase-like Zn-dependent oxidoreductase